MTICIISYKQKKNILYKGERLENNYNYFQIK